MPRRSRPPAPRARYHHGDLRAALVRAALDIVRERDVASVSLREAARRAGVSAGAPYHHFADKSLLLAEVAEEGFRLLGEALDRALLGAAEAGSEARLQRMAAAYVRFAVAQPGHYRVMFSPELLTPAAEARVHPVAMASFERLVAEVARARPAGPPDDVLGVAVTLWAGCHGLASLQSEGVLRAKDGLPLPRPERLAALVTGHLAALAAGFEASRPARDVDGSTDRLG